MPAPTRPVAPPQALRSNPDTFSANAEASIQYQWTALPTWIEGMGDYTQEQADAATAAALTGDVAPDVTKALNYLRLNADGTALEYRTPAQTISDAGVTATAAELNILDGVASIASQAQAEAGASSDTLMTPLRTRQAIPTGIAAQSVGAIGTYAMLREVNTSSIATGAIVAGSNLRYSNAGGTSGVGGVAGNWMLMGLIGATTDVQSRTSLFLRVS